MFSSVDRSVIMSWALNNKTMQGIRGPSRRKSFGASGLEQISYVENFHAVCMNKKKVP